MSREKSDEHLLFVVRATNVVESRMKDILCAYLQVPEQRSSFAYSYLFNNAIVSFAGKFRLILSVARELSLRVDREAFQVVLSRRNAFAHQDHLRSVRVITDHQGFADVAHVVESVKGSGELEATTQETAFAEFVAAYSQVEEDLKKLQLAVGTGNEA